MARSPKCKLPVFDVQESLIKSGRNTDWSHDFYKILETHATGRKGQGVKVAVLDTGVDLTHNSFQRAIREGRLKSIDARVNGRDPVDRNGHGTWCVSRYISDGPDSLGFAPECFVTSYKVLDRNGGGSLADVVRGVEMAIGAGAHIISTSLGSPQGTAALQRIAQKAQRQGIIWLSASGNDSTREGIDFPAKFDEVISCGSHNSQLHRSKFSDWGIDLDLYGAGEQVKAAYLNNKEAFMNGTSMGTPTVGALLALFYRDLKDKYGKVDREVLKQIATCQK